MNTKKTTGIALLVATVGLSAAAVVALRPVEAQADGDLPVLTENPTGIRGLLTAQPFALGTPYTHEWRADRPAVSSGWLLTLDVDPTLAMPRNGYEKVLFVGDQTAERINRGDLSGKMVVIVPSELGADGMPTLDLTEAPIWFGTQDILPEALTAAQISDELAQAQAKGMQPMSDATVEAALQTGGDLQRFTDDYALRMHSADLIERYSPEEVDLIAGLRVERL